MVESRVETVELVLYGTRHGRLTGLQKFGGSLVDAVDAWLVTLDVGLEFLGIDGK